MVLLTKQVVLVIVVTVVPVCAHKYTHYYNFIHSPLLLCLGNGGTAFGVAYGSIQEPVNLGSGGGSNAYVAGGMLKDIFLNRYYIWLHV